MRNVHNQPGHYGGQISQTFTISCSVVVYGVDHDHGILATLTGLAMEEGNGLANRANGMSLH